LHRPDGSVAGAIHAHSSEVTGYDGCVRGDETRVVDAFCAWLERDGWIVHREIDFIDVAAERGDERFYGETKGRRPLQDWISTLPTASSFGACFLKRSAKRASASSCQVPHAQQPYLCRSVYAMLFA
jgi:hypothetical protein